MPQALQTKPVILLVDDHPGNLLALEAVLGTSDYQLVTASSGPEALSLVEKQDFALILLDVHMPGMDGYEVARRIKALPRAHQIPIVLITAIYREDPYVLKAYEVGAVEYFSKPFNPEVLRLKVGIYAELYRKTRTLQHHEEEHRRMEEKVRELSRTLDQREQEDERRAAELATILESVSDALYVGDEAGITRCNAKALSMFGFDTYDQINQHFERLAERIRMRYPETDIAVPPYDQPFAHALRGESYVGKIKIRPLAGGEDRLIACAAAPVIYGKQIIGAVVVNSEITELEG